MWIRICISNISLTFHWVLGSKQNRQASLGTGVFKQDVVLEKRLLKPEEVERISVLKILGNQKSAENGQAKSLRHKGQP
jgi:hypothetical protein